MAIHGSRWIPSARRISCASSASPGRAELLPPADSSDAALKQRLREQTSGLMLIPGLSGSEGRVRRAIAETLAGMGIESRADRLGNLIATLAGTPAAAGRPSVMLFAHMD